MTSNIPELPPFLLQPVLEELYHSRDLLDLSAPAVSDAGPSTPPPSVSSPTPITTSLFSSATSIAAAAGRRAAAVASAAASPASIQSAQFRTSFSPERNATSASSDEREVRCVEGYGNNLYVGGSDGVVEWWVCDGGSSPQGEGWTMRHKYAVFPKRPISKIILLPKVSRMFLLSDGTLHPLALPNLEVLPSTVIAPMRGVLSVILDDEELEWSGSAGDERGAEMTIVLVRRKGLGIYRLGTRMVNVKEIPLPAAPTHHALFSTFLCAAIPSNGSVNYSIIDLSDASMTEVLPVSQVEDYEPPNIVVIPGENEFLVTSYTGASTMGVFLNSQGDPVRGTMEWEDHPLSIRYIIALLRNHSIVIHALIDLDKPVQTIQLDPGAQLFGLSYSPYGISVRDVTRDERMKTTSILLLGGKLTPIRPVMPPALDSKDSNTSTDGAIPTIAGLDTMEGAAPSPVVSPEGEEPPSGSGLTPPSSPPSFKRQPITPKRSSSLLKKTAPPVAQGPFSTTVAETLVLGPNSIQSLAPTPVVLKLERLCAERKMDEAIAMVDEERRKGRRGEVDSDKQTHSGTMRLLHLFLGFHLFANAMFERAGDYLLRGKSDPRLLVRAFPGLRGKVIGSAEEVEVLEGLKGVLEDIPVIDVIISEAVDRNHSLVDSPSQDSLPNTDEMRQAMMDQAKTMLTEVLRKTRQSRRKGGGPRGIDSRKIDIVIDTTLAKLLAESGTVGELFALLAGSNDAVLSELEPFLAQRPYVLSAVMRHQGKIDRVLELLQEVAESDKPDPLCPDPIEEIASQLESVTDPALLRKYSLWLIAHDVQKGLNILMNPRTSAGETLISQDPGLLDDLRNVNQEAANQYLEYLVVGRKSPDRKLHEDLLSRLLAFAEQEIRGDGVKYHLEELDAEFRLAVDPEPYCVFLADVAPHSPVKLLRLKIMLFLQGSPFFDLQQAVTKLEEIGSLKYELAIVLGRLGQHRRALQLLAREIGDSVSAQTYCTHGGELIPPRLAHRVTARVQGLEGWAELTEIGRTKKDYVSNSHISSTVQADLVMDLLEVYMRDGASTSKETAALLNAQSVHLDALKVLELVPNEWELDVVSSFLKRSLRRQAHDRATRQILKAISAGQNLQTSEEYLDTVIRIRPAVVTEPSPGVGPNAPYEGSVAATEKDDYLAEKISVNTENEKEGEEERGFFSMEAVNKELQDIRTSGEKTRRHQGTV